MNNKPIWTCSACGKTIDDPPATSQMPHCECGAYSWYSFPSDNGIRDTLHQRATALERELAQKNVLLEYLKKLEDERDSWGPQFFTDLADTLGMEKESSLDSMMKAVKDMKCHLETFVHGSDNESLVSWGVYSALLDARKFLDTLGRKQK